MCNPSHATLKADLSKKLGVRVSITKKCAPKLIFFNKKNDSVAKLPNTQPEDYNSIQVQNHHNLKSLEIFKHFPARFGHFKCGSI